MGPAVIGLMSFSGIVCVGYFHVAVMGAVIGLVIGLSCEIASEVETRFVDLILSRPVARHQLITRSAVVVLLCTAFVLSLMMIGTWVGLGWLAPEGATWPSSHLIRSLALNLGLLMFCWAGVGIGVSSFCRRRSVAGAVAGLMALTTYLLDYLARAWEPAEHVAWLSPFRYYNPLDLILGNPTPWYNLWVLLGVGITGLGLGYVVFWKRDI
jgi:ABC-2 type transport system permease protein